MIYFINKMLYFKEILDRTDWSSGSKSSWIHGGSNSLFFAFARGTRGWRTNSCFLMCRDGTSSKEGKKSAETGWVYGGGEEWSNNRNHVGQRPWPARRFSQMDRRVVVVVVSMSLSCIAVVLLLNRGYLLFLFHSCEIRDEGESGPR